MDPFRAFLTTASDGDVIRGLQTLEPSDLPDGDVTVRIEWSGVNYKDALATVPKGNVARTSPLVPGIDLAGEVIASEDPGTPVGQQVLVHGYGLGVTHHGGFAELARVPSGWVVPLPDGLTTRSAMVLGTAGFTAALCLHHLEQHGLAPDHGPVLVTGASGGVGSVAVALLATRGYRAVASTGKDTAHDFLHELGAQEVVARDEITAAAGRPLGRERWAAAIDPVGGTTLAGALTGLRYSGAAACCGLTGGPALETTVLPFILRGCALLGADSVETPMPLRRRIWSTLARADVATKLAESSSRVVGLDAVEPVLDAILRGEVRGRVLVRPR